MTRIRSVTDGEYTIRVEKDRYDVFEATVPVSESNDISPSTLVNTADYYYLFHNNGNLVQTYSDFRTAFSVRCVMR